MDSFKRVFRYIWPQWPSIIVVVTSAIVVAALFSLTFMAAIPILKVIMGEEGLHGWVDRKVSSHRYGVKFDLPSMTDFSEQDKAYYLLVTQVDDSKAAASAGILKMDRVTGVNDLWPENGDEMHISNNLLDKLASAGSNEQLKLQVHRYNEAAGKEEIVEITFDSGKRPFFLGALEGLMSFVPEEQTKSNKTKSVVIIMIVLTILTVTRCIAKFLQGYLAQKVMQTGISNLRSDIFSHSMDMPVGFFESERPSDAVSRIINDTATMGKAIKILLGKALREPLNAFFFMMGALYLNWQLTLIFLCGGPFVLGIVGVFGKKMKRASKKSLMVWSQMLAKLQETLAGIKIVKVYGQQAQEKEKFNTVNSRLLKQLLKISKVDAATTPVLEVMGMLAGASAIIIGAYWVNSNQMDGSEFIVLLMLLGSAAEAVRKTSDIWNKIQEANAASERVFEIMEEVPEKEPQTPRQLGEFKKEIEFRDVYFSYPKSESPVLRGISFSVKAGHNVAIVGPNGSGKSTLVNLIPRFYPMDKGTIIIDGNDTSEVSLASLRRQIGMVTQNVVTFNDTIAANISYGKPGASMDEIISASKRAFAHEFISPLKDGYDTIIGEHGTGLSGGQLQRIVIARAILKDPSILIFDEATSQVDADSEAKIHKAIEEIMKDRTSFIIAHRFSTILNADMIVVMDKGKIVATGKHDELIKKCKLYQNLYETQIVTS